MATTIGTANQTWISNHWYRLEVSWSTTGSIVLDKGVVITGDIKIKLVDIELLTIRIRLVTASVDKALEMGLDWWTNNSDYSSRAQVGESQDELKQLRKRVRQLQAGQAAP